MQVSTIAERDWQLEKASDLSVDGADQLQRAWAYLSGSRWWRFKVAHPPLLQARGIVLDFPEPYASTEHYPDGSALIRINVGLISFLQSFCMALQTGSSVVTPSGVAEAAKLLPAQLDDALMTLYRQWQALWDGAEVKAPAILPGERGSSIADASFMLGLLFVLMHEYGHAVLHRGAPHSVECEHEADLWALDAMMEFFGWPTRQPRITVAGSVIYIRAQAALQRLHCAKPLPAEYPPAAERIDRILRRVAVICQDEFEYYDVTTIAYAHDMRLEAAERALNGEYYLAPARADRLVSMIMSGLIEHTEGRKMAMPLPDVMKFELDRATPEIIVDASEIAQRIFSTTQPRYLEGASCAPHVRVRVDAFWGILDSLPASFHTQVRYPTHAVA